MEQTRSTGLRLGLCSASPPPPAGLLPAHSKAAPLPSTYPTLSHPASCPLLHSPPPNSSFRYSLCSLLPLALESRFVSETPMLIPQDLGQCWELRRASVSIS